MNLFFLHNDVRISAKHHCDKHVSKLAQELVQMFASNALVQQTELIRKADGEKHTGGYDNHPMTKWLHASLFNFEYGKQLLASLITECKIRGYKTSTYEAQLAQIRLLPEALHKGKPTSLTAIPLCMPKYVIDEHSSSWQDAVLIFDEAEQRYYASNITSAVHAYRQYYICEKAHFAKWAHSTPPSWWPGNSEPYDVFPAGALFCNLSKNSKNQYLLDFILQIQERAEELTTEHRRLMSEIPTKTKKQTPRAKAKTRAIAIGPVDELREKIKATLGKKNIPTRKLIQSWLDGEDLRGYANADERADAHIAYWLRARASA